MKVVVSLTQSLHGEKADDAVKKLAEFLEITTDAVLVLPAGISLATFPELSVSDTDKADKHSHPHTKEIES